jgi:hypothetical protein
MKTQSAPVPVVKRILLYTLAYVLWLVNIVVCFLAVMQVRSTASALWVVMRGNPWAYGLLNQVILLVGGLIGFAYVVFLESYYREAVAQRLPQAPARRTAVPPALGSSRFALWLTRAGLDVLLRRFVITTAIPLGVLALALLVLEVALRLL